MAMPSERLMPSGLLDLDQRAAEVLRMEEQHRPAVRADFRLPIAKHARARSLEAIAGGADILHLVADVMDAPARVPLEECGDRGVLAQRLQEFDLGVRQVDEDHRDAV